MLHIWQQERFWSIVFLTNLWYFFLWFHLMETRQWSIVNTKRDVENLFALVSAHRIFLWNFFSRSIYMYIKTILETRSSVIEIFYLWDQRKKSTFPISLFLFIIANCCVEQWEWNRVPFIMSQMYFLLES